MYYLQIRRLIFHKIIWFWTQRLGCDWEIKLDKFSNIDVKTERNNVLGLKKKIMQGCVLFCNDLRLMGFALFHQLNKQLQAYTHAHFGMQSMLVVYTVLPVCLGPIALLHHPIRCKRDATGRGCDGLGGKRWGSSLVPWLIPNEMQIHSPSVCWVPLFFLE